MTEDGTLAAEKEKSLRKIRNKALCLKKEIRSTLVLFLSLGKLSGVNV
jgi:hypothetical protein